MRFLFALFLLASCIVSSSAQGVDTSSFHVPIELDEVVVHARNEGFNVANFINIIKEDTTFYKAFKTLRLTTFNADNDIKVYGKKGKVQASLLSETKQIYRNGCRTMKVLEEKTTGDFYEKDGSYNYYTAQLYASLFFTKGTICGEDNIVKGSLNKELAGKTRLEKSKTQLKLLMFNPGANIPGLLFIGNKVGIFEPENAKMYQFKLGAGTKNGEQAYVFEAIPKPMYRSNVVINKFVTWFRASDYSVISRDYSLSYNAIGYDFDVDMHVDLLPIGNRLLPALITYRGNWKIITKPREHVNFTAQFYY